LLFQLTCVCFFLRSGNIIYASCSGAINGLIGNPVRIGDGPAAVIGDKSRMKATVRHLIQIECRVGRRGE